MSKPISSALLALNDECRNHTMEYTGMVVKLDAVVYDALLREETELALSRTGRDVGTPILTFDPGAGTEASLFGPVISKAPKGEAALQLWDAVVTMARTPGFAELMTTLRNAYTDGSGGPQWFPKSIKSMGSAVATLSLSNSPDKLTVRDVGISISAVPGRQTVPRA